MADDEKCIEVGKFVWKYHESVGWYDADEDDPAMDTEIALLDEIERLRAAGDALAAALNYWNEHYESAGNDMELLQQWQQARRG